VFASLDFALHSRPLFTEACAVAFYEVPWDFRCVALPLHPAKSHRNRTLRCCQRRFEKSGVKGVNNRVIMVVNGSLLSIVESRVPMVVEVLRHDQTLPRKSGSRSTGGLYAISIDNLFDARAQRHGFRRYLEGMLLPAERNKTWTALANTEPVAGA